MTNISPYSYNPTMPEHVLPAQFFTSPAIPGSVRLAFAVLEDALSALTTPIPGSGKVGRRRSLRIRQEAHDWITSDNARYVFSFVNICAALGFEADYIRRGVLRPGFHLKEGLRATIVTSGNAPRQTTVSLLMSIDLKAQRKARRTV